MIARLLNNLRLRTKLSLVVIASTLMASLLLFAAVTVLEYHDSRHRVEERARGLARVLAQNVRAPLSFEDPAAAQAALGKDDPEYSQIRSAMLAGITQKDPEMGFRLAVEDPSGYHSGWLMESGIQTLGIDGARVALQKVMDGVGESAAQNPAVSMLYRGLTEAMFHQKWTAGESEKMLPWLEAQKGQPLLQDSLIDHGAKDVVMQGKLDVALDWLDRMNEGREQGRAGGFGVLNGLLENPGQLATLDPSTLDRIVGLTTSQNGMTERLAGLLEKVSPDHAARLRALPGARRPAGFSPGVPMTTPGH